MSIMGSGRECARASAAARPEPSEEKEVSSAWRRPSSMRPAAASEAAASAAREALPNTQDVMSHALPGRFH